MIFRKIYSEFVEIVESRKLEIVLSSERSDSYHLVTKDGIVFYECIVAKDNSADHLHFNENFLPDLQNKFLETGTNSVVWDEMITNFPTPTTDLYTYKKNGEVVQTILVTYQSSSKKVISNLKKTRF